MSTRSNIGILYPNGSVRMVYCHSDGYPEYNGKILLAYYTPPVSKERSKQLIARIENQLLVGQLRGLEKDGTADKFPESDLSDVETYPFKEAAQGHMEEYLYLYDITNNKWIYSDHGSNFKDLALEPRTKGY